MSRQLRQFNFDYRAKWDRLVIEIEAKIAIVIEARKGTETGTRNVIGEIVGVAAEIATGTVTETEIGIATGRTETDAAEVEAGTGAEEEIRASAGKRLRSLTGKSCWLKLWLLLLRLEILLLFMLRETKILMEVQVNIRAVSSYVLFFFFCCSVEYFLGFLEYCVSFVLSIFRVTPTPRFTA